MRVLQIQFSLLVLALLLATGAGACSHSSPSVPELPPPQPTNAGNVVLAAATPDSVRIQADRVSVTIPDSEIFAGRIRVEQTAGISVSTTSTVSFYKSADPFSCRFDNLLVQTRELLVERLPVKVLTGKGMTFEGAVQIVGRSGKICPWKAWVESDSMDFSRAVALRFILDQKTVETREEETVELELYEVHDLLAALGVTESKLAEDVRANACPEAWKLPGRSIEVTQGVLVVVAAEREHKEVARYLGSRRPK